MLKNVTSSIEPMIASMTPMDIATARGAKKSVSKVQRRIEIVSNPETLVSGYTSVITRLHTFYVRGRTAASTIRAMVFQDLQTCTDPLAVRALWVSLGVRALARALGIDISRDVALMSDMSSRFSAAACDVRQKMVAGLSRKGMSLSDAWDDLRAQLPEFISRRPEGTGTWALAMAWMVLNPPTGRWVRLLDALRHKSIAGLSSATAHGTALPATIASPERIEAALTAGVHGLSRTYSVYYSATSEACYVFSRSSSVVSDVDLVSTLRVSARAWAVRAAVAATLSVRKQTAGDTPRMVVSGNLYSFTMTVAPYNSYAALRAEVFKTRCISPLHKAMFPAQVDGEVSQIFRNMDTTIGKYMPETRCTRYTQRMSRLHTDIEKTIREFRLDLCKLLVDYETEGKDADEAGELPAVKMEQFDLDLGSIIESMRNTFYDYLVQMPYPDNDAYETRLMSLPAEVQTDLLRRHFATLDELIVVLAMAEEEAGMAAAEEAII
jgi:hypothetical protein